MAFRSAVFAALVLTSCTIFGDAPSGDLERFAEGDRSGWQPLTLETGFDLSAGSDEGQLVGIAAFEDFRGEIFLDDDGLLGECDPRCRNQAELMRSSVLESGAVPTARGYRCGNCEYAEVLFVFQVRNDAIRPIAPDEIISLVAPIDTAYEALLAFGPNSGVRPDGDGWQVITEQFPDCTPADVTFTLWSVDAMGQQTELDSYVRNADLSEPEACA